MHSLDSFVVGRSNKEAYQAALITAANPGNLYNPLLIFSDSGLGKTHLMQSIGNYIYKQNPKLKICYVSAENDDLLTACKGA